MFFYTEGERRCEILEMLKLLRQSIDDVEQHLHSPIEIEDIEP
ncbi:hypothetical protein AB4124_18260 [Paenibacillus sp. 2KB_20]